MCCTVTYRSQNTKQHILKLTAGWFLVTAPYLLTDMSTNGLQVRAGHAYYAGLQQPLWCSMQSEYGSSGVVS